MFRKQPTQECPNDPYLAKRGLVGRKLGPLEAVIDYGQRLHSFFVNVNVVFISCRKEIEPDQVRAALKKLCQRHPNLRMGITTGETVEDRYLTYFETVPEPELEIIDHENWKETAEGEFKTKFQGDILQWRVKMLKASRDPDTEKWRQPFVFVFNHAVCDGGSIIAGALTSFFQYLEDCVTGHETEVESFDLLPAKEAIFPAMALTLFDRIKYKLYDLFRGPLVHADPVVADFMKVIEPEVKVRATKIVPIDLTLEETSAITKKCREHGIKVNGYLTAATVMATGRLYRKYVRDAPKELTLDIPFIVNLRRFADPPIPDDQINFINSMIPFPVTIPDDGSVEAFWEIAKQSHTRVHNAINGSTPTDEARFYNYMLISFDDFLKLFRDSPTPMHLVYLTNIGNFQIKSQDPDDENACTFEANYSGTSNHEFQFDAFVNSAHSINGRLMWTLTYYTHKCSDQVAEEYMKDVKDTLLRMSQ